METRRRIVDLFGTESYGMLTLKVETREPVKQADVPHGKECTSVNFFLHAAICGLRE